MKKRVVLIGIAVLITITMTFMGYQAGKKTTERSIRETYIVVTEPQFKEQLKEAFDAGAEFGQNSIIAKAMDIALETLDQNQSYYRNRPTLEIWNAGYQAGRDATTNYLGERGKNVEE
jgi:hypothetical protein